VTYPLLPAALAAERIADLHRVATRRRLVLAVLRARRQRPAAAAEPRPFARTELSTPVGPTREHLCDAECDAVPVAADSRSATRREGGHRVTTMATPFTTSRGQETAKRPHI